MDLQLRSSFYTSSFAKLAEIASNYSAPEAILLILRGQIQNDPDSAPNFSKFPNIPSANLELLRSYIKGQVDETEALNQIQEDPLEFHKTLTAILQINSNNSSAVMDSIRPTNVENFVLVFSALVNLNRIDLAENLVKQAPASQEDEAAIQYCHSIVSLLKGDYQEAYSALNELAPQCGESPAILNLIAICALQEGNYEEAEHLLMKALELTNNGNEQLRQATVVNLLALKRQKGESPLELEEQSLFRQFRASAPGNSYFAYKDQLENLFDSLLVG